MALIMIVTMLLVLWAIPLMLIYMFWWTEHNQFHR